MNIHFLARVPGYSKAWLENYGKIEIFGLLEFVGNIDQITHNLGSGMIYIYNRGQFHVLKE